MQGGYYYFKVDGEIRYDFKQPFASVDSLICNILEPYSNEISIHKHHGARNIVALEKIAVLEPAVC